MAEQRGAVPMSAGQQIFAARRGNERSPQLELPYADRAARDVLPARAAGSEIGAAVTFAALRFPLG